MCQSRQKNLFYFTVKVSFPQLLSGPEIKGVEVYTLKVETMTDRRTSCAKEALNNHKKVLYNKVLSNLNFEN